MPGSRPEANAALEAAFHRWLNDPESDVVHVELVPGLQERWAVRMRQTVRDATTVWWELGQRSLRCEAYVLPPPDSDADPHPTSEVHRQCLVRNAGTWRVHFAVDREGAVVLRGRLPLARVEAEELDLILGEIYEIIEVSFRPLLTAWLGRRGTSEREKSS